MIDNNKVVDILRQIKDPSTGIDILKARRIKNLKIDEGNIFFTLTVNDLPQEAKFAINAECYSLLKAEFKDVEVHIHFEADKTDRTVLPQVKNIVVIASGKGGVGKSTVSTNMAVSLANQGYKVGLMDADLYGPSIPTMMNLKGQRPQVKEIYGKHKLVPIEQYGVHLMSIGFIIDPEQAVVLRGPRLSGVIKQFVGDCLWPELDYLIIDLPPGTGDIQLTLVQSIPITGAVIVTTPQQVAVSDAIKAANMFRIENVNVPILGVVENMSWFTPEELPDNKYCIFGQGGADQLAEKYETSVLGRLPLILGIREAGDAGAPIALKQNTQALPYIEAMTQSLVDSVARRNKNLDPTQVVKVTSYDKAGN